MSICLYDILKSMKNILGILFAVVCLLVSTHKVYAANEFLTSYSTSYTFDTLGDADISHTIELTNKLAHIYPTEYTIAISSADLKDIRVRVGDRPNEFSQEQTDSISTIHIPIKNANIGKDQTTKITLDYHSRNLAEKIGDTYTLTLPRTQKGNEAASFTRTVHVPTSFPQLKVSSLSPQTESTENGVRTYVFVGGGGDSLTALFGESVTYNVNLSYLLKNNSAGGGTTEIALPPDTPYQQVILREISPKPTEIVVDPDGNWLARYNISSLEKKTVTANLQITVDPEPIYFDPSTNLPKDVEPFWEQSSNIKNLARQLKSPNNIYQYLLDTYTYDYTAISTQKRLGAEAALKAPTTAICTEFTDTFVALTRSLGIPSRALIGFAYTTDPSLRPQATSQDILHAYPEYFDLEHKIWRAVDPTWGHTTGNSSYFDRLDFSHITFVRWGNESNYPLPPGSYRESVETKQIDVTVSPETPTHPKLQYSLSTEGDATIVINTGNASIIRENLELNGKQVYVPYIPPYGHFRVDAPASSKFNRLVSRIPLYPTLGIILFLFLGYMIYLKIRTK